MGKIGFLYPGQGSQKVGMGKELLQTHPALFEDYFVRSDQAIGEVVSRFCLEGPAEKLNQTHIAQPALFISSLALTACAHQLGIFPDMVAGHSLGEYSAAVACGALSFTDGLALVSQRGRLMKRIQDEQPGAMAAVIGLSKESLTLLCRDVSQHELVLVTNWNAPGQLVVSGTENGVRHLIEKVRTQSEGKAIRLPVSGAFHTPMMESVKVAIRQSTRDLPWHDAEIPLVANVSGEVLTRGEEIRRELIEQITSAVQWVWCIETLVAHGCDTLIELGSGQVLTRLVRLIAPHVTALAIDSPMKLENFALTRHTAAAQGNLRVLEA